MLQKIKIDDEDNVETFVKQLLMNDYWVHVKLSKSLSQELGIQHGCSYEIEFEKEGEE